MQLILVRHAEPEQVADDPQGADPVLTSWGRQQAQVLADAFAAGSLGRVDAVVSSTMRRAQQTAAPVGAALGLAVRTDARLVELDHGWTTYGADFSVYPSRSAAWDAINAGEFAGQRFAPDAFAARVAEGIEDIARNETGTVAVMCHGGVISAYLARVIGASRPLFFTPALTSLTRVLALPDGHRELLTAGETPHVPRAERGSESTTDHLTGIGSLDGQDL